MYLITKKQIKTLLNFVATKGLKENLKGIAFSHYKDKPYAVATDGRMIAYVEIDEDKPSDEVIISRDVMKEATKGTKKTDQTVKVKSDGTVDFYNGNMFHRVNGKIDERYPHWFNAIPSPGRMSRHKVYLSAKLLKAVAQSAIDAQSELEDPVLEIYIPDENGFSGYCFRNEGVAGVFMPMRVKYMEDNSNYLSNYLPKSINE